MAVMARAHYAFPVEIVHAFICDFEPTYLATIALVSPTFQIEAERLLYKSITLTPPSRGKVISCFKTLATGSHRATLVRSLVVAYRDEYDLTRTIFNRVCRILPAMTSLKHLDLRLPPGPRYISRSLEPVLKCVYKFVTGLKFFTILIVITTGVAHSLSPASALMKTWIL
jgi:hypothetical protein